MKKIQNFFSEKQIGKPKQQQKKERERERKKEKKQTHTLNLKANTQQSTIRSPQALAGWCDLISQDQVSTCKKKKKILLGKLPFSHHPS